VPLACDRHPEFGYLCPSAGLRRKLRLAVAAVTFGLMAGASGMAVLVADRDSRPPRATAPAPPQAVSEKTSPESKTVVAPVAPATFARKSLQAEAIKPACRENRWEYLDGCASGAARKARTVHVPAQPPAIAAVAIGHREGRPIPPSQRAMPVADPPDAPDGSAKSADAAPVADVAPASAAQEAPAPAVSAKKPRKTAGNRARHRDHREYSSWAAYNYPYGRGGYAYYRGPPIMWW
jgi:hypothetical protein